MKVTHEIEIDLTRNAGSVCVPVMKGDAYSRVLRISLSQGRKPWAVPEDAAVVVDYKKPDGTAGVYDTMPDGAAAWEVEEGKLLLHLAPQMLTAAGTVQARVKLIRGEAVLSVFPFRIIVGRSVGAGAESEDYINWRSAFLPQVTGAKAGQWLRISEVDAAGRVLAAEPVEEPGGVDEEVIAEAVAEYLEANPPQESDPTVPDWAKAAEKPEYAATEVGAVATVNGVVPDALGNVEIPIPDSSQNADQSGLTKAQITALDGMFKICAYTADATNAYKAFQTAFGIGGEVEPDEPDVPVVPDEPDTEKTLTSISAVYSGGAVTAGTAVNDLTGIVVTAHYSDGSSVTVTGYTLSGTIAEGSNTITVSYGGKTTTFAVTGVSESGGEEDVTALKGIMLPNVPTNWSANDDWQYAGNSGNLYDLIGVRYLYRHRVFSGTVYVRTVAKTPYSNYAVGMKLVAEDYLTNQTAEGETLAETTKTIKFNNQFLYVSTDGSEYEYLTSEPDDGRYCVRLQKFDIPEGQVAILHMLPPSSTGTINIDGGWTTVFFEDPTNHITVTEVYE